MLPGPRRFALVHSLPLIAVVILVAGCLESANPRDHSWDPLAPQARVDDAYGGILGIVTDNALLPVPGATVKIEGTDQTTSTDELGRFAFSYVPPGHFLVTALALGYKPALHEVEVVAGRVSDVALQLDDAPSEEAYFVVYQGTGRITCSAGVRPGMGIGVCNVVTGAFAPSGLGEEESRVDFRLSTENLSQVRALVLETSWRPNQLGAGGLGVLWENAQDFNELSSGSERRYILGNVGGENPLRLVVSDDDLAELMKDRPPTTYCDYYGTCTIMGLAYAHASTLGSSAPADAGAYVDQRFTHFVTEFFVDPPPEDFTAVVDE